LTAPKARGYVFIQIFIFVLFPVFSILPPLCGRSSV
jgi:hypothetical protein